MQTNFDLFIHFKMGLQDLDGMIPWERDVYIELIKRHVEEENKKIREQESGLRTRH